MENQNINEPAQVNDGKAEVTAEETEKVTTKDVDVSSLQEEIKNLKAQARKWEERAKENKDAKPQLEKLMEDMKNIQSENEEVKQQLTQYQKEIEHTELLNRVSDATGLPANVLGAMKADTEEQLIEVATMLKQSVPLYPQDVNDGSHSVNVKMTRGEIAKIKNHHEREKAILENIIKE